MLAVDIGNSHIKWGWWQPPQFVHTGSVDYRESGLTATLDQHWQPLQAKLSGDAPLVQVACVAGDSKEQALTDWLQQHYSISPVFLRSSHSFAGVGNSYSDPAQYGADRWAALLGARALYGSTPVCIIDCGSAVTVELMDASGQHLGGRIMPGLAMMRQSLQQNTAAIGDTEGNPVDFANNTADAVSSGTLHMLAAACQDACNSARQRLGETVKIIITGGSSARVIPLLDNAGLCHEPHLVLHGLVYAAQQ